MMLTVLTDLCIQELSSREEELVRIETDQKRQLETLQRREEELNERERALLEREIFLVVQVGRINFGQ